MVLRIMALAAALMASAAFADAGPKQPTGKWIVNFDDAQCVATRNYGSEEDPIYLVLKAPPIGDVLQIGVVRKGGGKDATQTDGELVFDNQPAIRTNLLEFGASKLHQRALLVNLSARDLAPMRQAATLRIRARNEGQSRLGTRLAVGSSKADESFSLSQMAALLKMMDTCTADLRKVWNVYDETHPGGPLKQPPSGDIGGLFSPEDYPGVALLKDQMGSVEMVLLIDEKGQVADCTVTRTSGVAALDAQSCAVIRERGKFQPALGLDGKPAKSSWLQRITWRLQG
jgi:hypothetical protein